MNLELRFRSGVIWSVVGNIGNNIVSFVVFAIVAQLVEPQEIGVLAIAMVFVEMGKVFVYAGVPDLIVRQRVWDDGFALMCFWMNIAVALFCVLLIVVFIGPVAEKFYTAGISTILGTLALCFVFDALRVVPESKLRRDLNYKSLARRGIAANLIAGLVAIALALQGWGVWALVAQRLLSSLLTTIFTLFTARWIPVGLGSWIGFIPALGHGGGLVGAAMLKLLSDRLPDLLLGVLLGPVAVGIYRVGARGFEALVQFLVQPVRSASLAAYAANSHMGTLNQALLRSLASASLYTFPIFFGACALSSDFVHLVFGERWSDSSYVMAALCLAGPPLILSALFQSGLSAQQKTSTIFRLNAANVVSTLLVLVAGIPFLGLVGTTLALTARSYLGMVFNISIVGRDIGIRAGDLVQAMIPPLVASAFMLCAVAGVQHLTELPQGWRLLILPGIGVVCYVLTMSTLFKSYTFTTLKLNTRTPAPSIYRMLSQLLRR